ncbi:MAG: sulfite exporter TauE/SafE family protein [bacterium]|nr:sulfite exporter TauE/SafE family protein [bacterium]
MEIFYIIAIFILSGLALELTGFGVATVSMSLLLLFLDPLLTIPLVAIAALVTTGFLAWRIKEKKTWKRIKPLFIGVIFGVPLGIIMLSHINHDLLKLSIAIFFVIYSIYGLFFSKFKTTLFNKNKITSAIIGFFAGFFNSTVNIDGPLVALYESSDIKKNTTGYKDAIATYMFFTGILTVSGHLLAGRITRELILLLPYVIPSLILGIFTGHKLFSKINGAALKKIIYYFVLFSGLIIFIKYL